MGKFAMQCALYLGPPHRNRAILTVELHHPLFSVKHTLDQRCRDDVDIGERRTGMAGNEPVAVDDSLEDRKVCARLLVESHVVSACRITVIGSVTHRMRVGRMSA